MGIRKRFLSSMQQLSCSMLRMKRPYITEKYNGPGSLIHIAEILRHEGARKVLIITAPDLVSHKTVKAFVDKLIEFGIGSSYFTGIKGQTDKDVLDNGFAYYCSEKCDAVMAIGGGTVIDCAKLVALKAANPTKNINYFLDYTSTPKRAVPLYAAPSTAGTGAEISLISFYTDQKGRKCPVLSTEFVPRAVALDPDLLSSLSPEFISYCGMSTLAQAVEAYISTYSERFYRDTVNAPKACRMVFENLYEAYLDPDNVTARLNLMKASYYSGLAIRRATGGYIASLAHRMNEFYGIHFGKACSVFLPIILEEYMPEVISDLAAIAYHCDFTDDRETEVENAFRLIEQIKDLNILLKIPDHFDELLETDVDMIIKRTQYDARLCGCPKILSDSELEVLLFSLAYKRNPY